MPYSAFLRPEKVTTPMLLSAKNVHSGSQKLTVNNDENGHKSDSKNSDSIHEQPTHVNRRPALEGYK